MQIMLLLACEMFVGQVPCSQVKINQSPISIFGPITPYGLRFKTAAPNSEVEVEVEVEIKQSISTFKFYLKNKLITDFFVNSTS